MNKEHIGSNFDEFLKKEDFKDITSTFDDLVKWQNEEIQRLKAENKELKKECMQMVDENYASTDCRELEKLKAKNEKYKQALEEVREIANEPCIDDEDCETCNENCMSKDIINKINEVLKDV